MAHNPQHRGGAPYADRRTANKYAARSGIQPIATGNNRSLNASGFGAGNVVINRTGAGTGFSSGGRADASAAIRPSGVGGDRIGSRGVSANLGSVNAFGSAGFSGNSVRASSNRGNNSFGGGGAGSFSAGHGRGGAARGGGGGGGGG